MVWTIPAEAQRYSALDTSEVYAIEEMKNGKLWIGTYQSGIFIYDGLSLERLNTEDGLLHDTVWIFGKKIMAISG